MSFALRFHRELPAGTCVGVSLPRAMGSRCRRAYTPTRRRWCTRRPPRGARPSSAAASRCARRWRRWARAPTRRRGRSCRPPRGAPALPPGFVASISHKREIAVAIAARAEPTPRTTIGIDVEIPRSLRTDIAPRVLTPAERAEIAALDAARARRARCCFGSPRRRRSTRRWIRGCGGWCRSRRSRSAPRRDGGRTARLTLARSGEGPFAVELHDASDEPSFLSWQPSRPKRNDGRTAQL